MIMMIMAVKMNMMIMMILMMMIILDDTPARLRFVFVKLNQNNYKC